MQEDDSNEDMEKEGSSADLRGKKIAKDGLEGGSAPTMKVATVRTMALWLSALLTCPLRGVSWRPV